MIDRGAYVRAPNWYAAREVAARYLGLDDPMDRRMICTPEEF